MSITSVKPYSQEPIRLSGKTGEEQELLAAKKWTPQEKDMEKWISQQEELKKVEEQMKSAQSERKQTEQNMEAEREGMKVLMTCMEISRRILSGDKVPEEDHKYLRKHDIQLYTRSITLRRHKQDPYEYDRLSEEEKSDAPLCTVDMGTSQEAEFPKGAENLTSEPKLDVSI